MHTTQKFQRFLLRQAAAKRLTVAEAEPADDFRALAQATNLEFTLIPRRSLFCVTGEADIVDGVRRGRITVGADFIAAYEPLAMVDRPGFIRYLEYLLLVHCGGLLPLVLTGGTEAEALFAGMRMFGYEDDEAISLLVAKETTDYLRALRTGLVRGIDEYLAQIDHAYQVDFWDFLTEKEVALIHERFRERAQSLRDRLPAAWEPGLMRTSA